MPDDSFDFSWCIIHTRAGTSHYFAQSPSGITVWILFRQRSQVCQTLALLALVFVLVGGFGI
jgi:hypothetical protein